VTSAFQVRSGVVNNGPAKYTFIAPSIAECRRRVPCSELESPVAFAGTLFVTLTGRSDLPVVPYRSAPARLRSPSQEDPDAAVHGSP
jgi:hypothetical protein